MTDTERLERRLAAVERAVVDGDARIDDLADLESALAAIADLEDRLEEHERRIAELEGRTGSLEGYADELRSVNEEVERQAAAAVAAVDRLERRLAASSERDVTADHRDDDDPDPDGKTARERSSSAPGKPGTPDGSAATDDSNSDSEATAPERTAAAIVGRSETPAREAGSARGREGDDEGTPSFSEPIGETRDETSADVDDSSVVPANQQSVDRRLESGPSQTPTEAGGSTDPSDEPIDDSSTQPESEPETDGPDADGESDDETGVFATLRAKL